MQASEAAALAPSFPLQTFWDAAGFGGLQTINVAVPGYLTVLEDLAKNTPIDDLKSYVRWQLLQDHAGSLDQAFIDQDFSFWSTFTGQTQATSRWFRCFNETLSEFGHAVALPYVARHFDEEAKESASTMAHRARMAFSKRLENAAWLDTPTRDEALAKLDAMVAKVGYPEEGPDFAGLVIQRSSFLDNEITLRRFSAARSRARLGQLVDRAAWNLSPVSVNAIYTTTANDLTLPAVLLASPFFSAKRTEAANFGALGAVIGHEMTHGFDDRGRHFDGKGTLRDFWTPTVEARFVERTQCLVSQFDAYEALPSAHVNGTLTLGENIADLGGVNIAYAALFDDNNERTGSDGFTASQVFFLSYAQMWCEVMRPDRRSQELLTDSHAPASSAQTARSQTSPSSAKHSPAPPPAQWCAPTHAPCGNPPSHKPQMEQPRAKPLVLGLLRKGPVGGSCCLSEVSAPPRGALTSRVREGPQAPGGEAPRRGRQPSKRPIRVPRFTEE